MWFYLSCAIVCIISANGYKSSTPFIKNLVRGGDHFEGPHWADNENALYWTDITGQKIYRLDAETGNVTIREIVYGPVSLVVTVKDYPKLILVSSRSELYLLSWDSEQGDSALRLLTAVDLGKPDNRINDGKVDKRGRLWFGTMGKEDESGVEKEQGTLYMLTKENYINPAEKVMPVSISNGIAWTSDDLFMFYIDSVLRNIQVFDYDLDTGSIRNRRTLFDFQINNVTGVPDGMTIDTDGNLWVACYDGGKVIKIDSRAGKLLEQHKMPASKVTSVTWGGHNFATLFVTTSKRSLNSMQLAQEPEAGSLFAIENTGSRGYPSNQFIFSNADLY
ncbi:regucalcin-like [Pieris brassicae]|uniref:Regucalcin n=1 Tax=Pieris brassicae TaxID=7116 RepID=A0A9P0TEF0_PIEBR|nr:regucalcin-like [Pieris brassicae]CAH4027430.1 unnamed protein product [Pieris brassicae]